MEAIAPNALRVKAFGKRKMVGDRAVAAVEGSIEAGDLRQVRTARAQLADRRQIVRLMQRRQRRIALQIAPAPDRRSAPDGRSRGRHGRHDVRRQPDRPPASRAARRRQPNRRRQIRHLMLRVDAVDQALPIRRLGAQPRPRADAVHLAFDAGVSGRRRPRARTPGI